MRPEILTQDHLEWTQSGASFTNLGASQATTKGCYWRIRLQSNLDRNYFVAQIPRWSFNGRNLIKRRFWCNPHSGNQAARNPDKNTFSSAGMATLVWVTGRFRVMRVQCSGVIEFPHVTLLPALHVQGYLAHKKTQTYAIPHGDTERRDHVDAGVSLSTLSCVCLAPRRMGI